jgi:ferric-dicitrate binding protein FerR (iron transport regulator)
MSRTNRAGKPGTARDTMRHALAQATPLATNTAAVTRHGVSKSRAWAAPQVERTGQFLQQVAAPKLSALLSSAARKIEPAQPRRRRWTKGAGAAGLLAAGAAAAAVLRNHGKPAAKKTSDKTDHDAADDAQGPRPDASTDAEASEQDLTPTEGTVM